MNRLKELRVDAGITQADLAAYLKCSNNTVSRYELGERQPDYETLIKLAEYFKAPTSFLMGSAPFDVWDLINSNRKGFFAYINIPSDNLQILWGIDKDNPDASPLTNIVRFMNSAVVEARPTSEGDWDITLTPSGEMMCTADNTGDAIRTRKNKPTTQEGGEPLDAEAYELTLRIMALPLEQKNRMIGYLDSLDETGKA